MEDGLIGSHVNGVGLQDFSFTIRQVYISTTRNTFSVLLGRNIDHHLFDAISIISLCFDDDDITFYRLDSGTLFISGCIDQRQGGMLFIDDAHCAFLARRRIFDGGVGFAHLEDKHVFVLDGLAIRGKQQAEVVKRRTFIAALINVFGLAFYQHLHLGGCAIDGEELALGNPVLHLSGKVGNSLSLRLAITLGYDTDLCQTGTVGHDAGNGSNLQFVIFPGTGGEGVFAEVHSLLHAVDSASAPKFIAFGIGKGLDGKLLAVVFGGICPAIHALVSIAVLQHIVVHHRIARARCSVTDTEGIRHQEHHRNFLPLACHAGVAGNHLGNEGLDAIGFLGVIDTERMYFLNTILDRDFLHIHLEAINGLPSAAFKTLRAHKPR